MLEEKKSENELSISKKFEAFLFQVEECVSFDLNERWKVDE